MYYENEGTCTYMYFLPLKFSQYPSRPVPVPELFGKYPTRPVPKSKTPTRQTLFRGDVLARQVGGHHHHHHHHSSHDCFVVKVILLITF